MGVSIYGEGVYMGWEYSIYGGGVYMGKMGNIPFYSKLAKNV